MALRIPSWPATLQPPCLSREPKARVATLELKMALMSKIFGVENGFRVEDIVVENELDKS